MNYSRSQFFVFFYWISLNFKLKINEPSPFWSHENQICEFQAHFSLCKLESTTQDSKWCAAIQTLNVFFTWIMQYSSSFLFFSRLLFCSSRARASFFFIFHRHYLEQSFDNMTGVVKCEKHRWITISEESEEFSRFLRTMTSKILRLFRHKFLALTRSLHTLFLM